MVLTFLSDPHTTLGEGERVQGWWLNSTDRKISSGMGRLKSGCKYYRHPFFPIKDTFQILIWPTYFVGYTRELHVPQHSSAKQKLGRSSGWSTTSETPVSWLLPNAPFGIHLKKKKPKKHNTKDFLPNIKSTPEIYLFLDRSI